MQRQSHPQRTHNTISLKPSYDFNTNYLDFHISRQRSPSQKNPLTHRSSINTHTISYKNNRQRSSNKVQQTKGEDQGLREIISRFSVIKDGSNEMMKTIVQQQLLAELTRTHPLMKKLNKYLVESLLLLSTLHTYQPQEAVIHWQGQICFVLYGSFKLYNQDIKITVERGQLFGQHLLFDRNPQLKAKSLGQGCLMMLPLRNYQTIREESIKNGLKDEISGLEIAIRLNFIGKRFGDSKNKFTH